MTIKEGGPTMRSNETRRRIALAAGEVFAAVSYPSAKMTRIAAEAGLSRAVLYAQYGTKLALAESIIATETQRWTALIEDETAANSDPLATLIQLSFTADHARRTQPTTRAAFRLTYSGYLPPTSSAPMADLFADTTATLLAHARSGARSRRDVNSDAALIIDTIFGVTQLPETERSNPSSSLQAWWRLNLPWLTVDPARYRDLLTSQHRRRLSVSYRPVHGTVRSSG